MVFGFGVQSNIMLVGSCLEKNVVVAGWQFFSAGQKMERKVFCSEFSRGYFGLE